jgi:hypothetical protein
MAIDLTPFCSAETQFATPRPIVRAGWRYATNGYIAVRVPAEGKPEHGYQGHPAVDMLARQEWDKCIEPWPQPDPITGRVPCPACGGWADTAPDCSHCDDEGWVTKSFAQPVGDLRVAIHHDQQIRALPNVRYQPHADEKRPIAFVFDGGQGVVMPLPKECQW